MVFLLRALPALIELGLLIYGLIDCIQTPDGAVRNLPKWLWILIIFFPFFGPILWLVFGRPERSPSSGFVSGYPEYKRRRPTASAPDDDPDFLRELGKVNSEHERTLEKWEQDLRRREEELKRRDDDPPR
jgi:hypothetical protein